MRIFLLQLSALTILLAAVFQVSPAQAQATRTWVSGVGDDANPCSRTAPCKTFAGAISKTAVNGEIDCLDPGGFGTLTITKSITLDCHQTMGSILNSGTNGINISYDSFGDPRKIVRLRGLTIQGADTGVIGIRITGAANSVNSAVFIEDTVIDGVFGGAAKGISDERSGGGELYISNTTVRNTGAIGVAVNPLAGTAVGARIDVSINNLKAQNCTFGYAAGSATRTMISDSVFSGNTGAGLVAEGPFAASEMDVQNSVSSGNGTGVQNGGGATIRLSNSDIAFNTSAFSGAVTSYSNNRVPGTIGTAPTPIGSAAAATGQQ